MFKSVVFSNPILHFLSKIEENPKDVRKRKLIGEQKKVKYCKYLLKLRFIVFIEKKDPCAWFRWNINPQLFQKNKKLRFWFGNFLKRSENENMSDHKTFPPSIS